MGVIMTKNFSDGRMVRTEVLPLVEVQRVQAGQSHRAEEVAGIRTFGSDHVGIGKLLHSPVGPKVQAEHFTGQRKYAAQAEKCSASVLVGQC